jgi:CheY-like chemotaxis protein
MKKILLVEDDDLQRMMYRRFLELDGYTVTDFGNGMDALSHFRKNQNFDVVVTDVLMPGLDGSGLIYSLLKIDPSLPIVAISAGRRVLAPEFTLESATFAGASSELKKPFTRHDLKAAVERVARK